MNLNEQNEPLNEQCRLGTSCDKQDNWERRKMMVRKTVKKIMI